MKLGVILRFNAAHSLPGYPGMCSRIHGHTYTLEVVVEGELNPETKFVIDYFELRKIVEKVVSNLDHCYLNQLLEYPSCEMIAHWIWEQLSRQLDKPGYPRLCCLKLWEGENCWVELSSK